LAKLGYRLLSTKRIEKSNIKIRSVSLLYRDKSSLDSECQAKEKAVEEKPRA